MGRSILIIVLLSFFLVGADHVDKYNRAIHFGGWIDADGDGQNTREEVLERQSLVKVKKDKNGKIIYGVWYCRYTGRLYDNPKVLDIDHYVPLREAYYSGAYKWDRKKRKQYANYLNDKNHLIVVYGQSNKEKGAKDITEWLPLIGEEEYIIDWYKIKQNWFLCFDMKEKILLEHYGIVAMNICGEKNEKKQKKKKTKN